MRTYILTILTGLFVLAGLQQAAAQVSVSVPRHVEQDVQRINEILDTHSNISNDFNQQIEQRSRQFAQAYRKFQSARSDAERNRYHDEAMYHRAQLLSTIHGHFTEIRSLANQILPIADRLANSDINSQAIERQLRESLESSNQMLEEVGVDLRRNTMVFMYANAEEGDRQMVDQVIADMAALEDQLKYDRDSMEEEGRHAIEQFENFSVSFMENIGMLVHRVRMMRGHSDRILNRIRFSATVDSQVLSTRGAIEGLERLFTQLDVIVDDFPQSIEKTNEILNQSYFEMFDGIMTPRNNTRNLTPPSRRSLTQEDHVRRLENNNR